MRFKINIPMFLVLSTRLRDGLAPPHWSAAHHTRAAGRPRPAESRRVDNTRNMEVFLTLNPPPMSDSIRVEA